VSSCKTMFTSYEMKW